ncbi:hydroxyacylglutathione hydrolase [Pseudidiomarina mangrovi]|uniref:hydroxyacylglutathione hydrolase n=1 Tax=Pseudidiomarina mangrovi TaxID=2487133 RepID=UPI000FCC3283|nr:hydroxyacylglutathione hydrolase [Pseudidiomarina mangrovi]CAI8157157.1 MAG: Hydroxyacylglutathione hydrolase [Pseudidiomarina mangrovi]
MRITAIAAFDDNYIWAIQPAKHPHQVVLVDPGAAAPCQQWLAQQQCQLAAILVTHHHWDHTDGIAELVAQWQCPVYGPATSPFSGITEPLQHGDTLRLGELDIQLQVLATPGHTLDHISYVGHDALFCGDTLFLAGCGRMFEGSPEQFHQSLRLFTELPAATSVYAAHEYSLANLRFAAAAMPDNQAVRDAQQRVQQLREQGLPSLPSRLADELAINPFLRAQSVAEFRRLREWKDRF